MTFFLSACDSAGSSNPQTLPTVAQLPPAATAITESTSTEVEEATPTPEAANTTPVPNQPPTQRAVPSATPLAATEIAVEMQPFALDGAGIGANITLAETVRIAGTASLTCDESGAYVISSPADSIPRISFTLPNDTPPGTYPLHDVIVEGIDVRPVLVLESGVTYDVQMDGLFVLTTLPPAEGGPVKGEFEYAVAALVDPTKVILVRGAFDFVAQSGFCV